MSSRREITFLIFLLFPIALQAFGIGLWQQQSFRGSLLLEGNYRSQENIFRSGKTEQPQTQIFRGELGLKSNSYLWHPNFLKLDLSLTYNPGIQNEEFIVVPNRSETHTAEQLRLHGQFFDQRPFSFNLFMNLNHNFINRDYAGRVEGFKTDYGAGLSYRNRVLPLTMSYLNSKWRQKELLTQKDFTNYRENLRLEAKKSFFKTDQHRLSFSKEDYSRTYGSKSKVASNAQTFRLHNKISFDDSLQRFWNSLAQFRKQTGAQSYDRFQLNERLTYGLPAGFKFNGIYNLNNFNQSLFKTKQQNLVARFEHQLYLSLNSRLFYEWIDINHSVYDEKTHQVGIAFDYKKKIPGGYLTMAYEGRRRSDDRNSDPAILNIIGEEQVLDDSKVVLLNNPNIEPTSVRVYDASGVNIYRENLDYVLIQRTTYLEIQRLAGGQIANAATVWIDYVANRSLSYNFMSNSNVFRFGLNLLNNLLEPYFRLQTLNYDHIQKSDDKILKTTLQRVYGLRLSKSFINAGFEFEQYDSNILPYRTKRYFIGISKSFYNKLNAYLRANWRDYELIAENERQQFADIAGRFSYLLGLNSQINLDGGYRFQEGRGVDLRLTNLRTEYSTRYRNIFVSIGLEIYRRNFSGEQINYNGGYVKVERKF